VPRAESLRFDITGLLMAAVAAVLFSFKAVLAKLMYRHGADAVVVMSLRMLMAGPFFAVLAIVFAWQAHRKQRSALSAQERWRILLLGFLGYYLSSILDFAGLQYISASLERLILFLTPGFVALFGLMFFRRAIARKQWQGLLLSYCGVVGVFFEQLHFNGPHVGWGSLLVLLAALSYAGYLTLSGELVNRIGSLRLAAYAMSVSCVCMALHFWLSTPIERLLQPAPVLWLSLWNAIFCTIVPVFLTMEAVRRIGATRSAQLSMLGPVSLLFLAHWLLGENITPLQLVGTAVVLLGIFWVTSTVRQSPKAAAKSADQSSNRSAN
jgi:drug/metabolite transporter (DMT)-like permease